MVVVAVVGGTGHVGKTIVEAFKDDGKYDIIVFTRKVSTYTSADHVRHLGTNQRQVSREGSGFRAVTVDYNDIEQLAQTLDANKVHTIISTIVMIDPVAAQSELNLVAAAAKSSCTKRFVASNWGLATPVDE
jgi:dTDP-4-dehydrorhamnose reductase